MPIGTVKFFDNAKGYGFITNEAGGNDAFVHITAVEAAGMRTLEKEQRLSYELENDKRGKSSAVNLQARSEEHTSELQSLMRISYAVFCLKKKNTTITTRQNTNSQ